MKLEYYIFVTNSCNLSCGYCSVLEDSKKYDIPLQPQYKISELRSFILETQNKYSADSLDIIFFGGEPSLNPTFVNEVIKGVGKKLGRYPVRYIFHTNGIQLLKLNKTTISNFDLIVVSINYEKINHSNLFGSYFGRIIKGVNEVKRTNNIPFLARLTITEKTSLYMDVLQVSNFFDYVYWQIQNCAAFTNYAAFYGTYKLELELLWQYWIKYLREGFQLNILPFISIAQLMLSQDGRRDFKKYLCGYNEFMIYIQTDGNCFSCAEEVFNSSHFVIGNIRDGIEFKAQDISKNVSCRHCKYIKLCSGRCGRMQERFEVKHIEEYCRLNAILFDKVISSEDFLKEVYAKYPELVKDIDDPMLRDTEYVP